MFAWKNPFFSFEILQQVRAQDVDNILENVQNFRLQQFYQQLQQQELKNLKQGESIFLKFHTFFDSH
jgi:hypothetical protein